MTHEVPASEIVDDTLNRTGKALMAGDFETFLEHFQLPQIMETLEGRQRIQTPDDLKHLFDSVRAFHKRQGIDRIVRSCRAADYKGEDSIEGVFEALFFNGNVLVQSVHSTFVMLVREGAAWRIGYNMYGVSDDNGFGDALVHAPGFSDDGAKPVQPAQLRAG